MMLKNIKKIKLVAIAKDEARYITEWIFHHSYFGFDTFDIYVNNTNDNTIALLMVLSKRFDINIIEADKLYEVNPEDFQSRAYNDALKNTDADEYAFVGFLDIDEFWTPKNFQGNISDFLLSSTDFDVMVFNWALHQSELDFSHCYSTSNCFSPNSHIKYVVRTGKKINAGIHNARGKGLVYVKPNLEKAEFIDETLAKVSCQKALPNAFIVHRLYRGELEYVSLLGRGRPRGDRFKTNRHGYYRANNSSQNFTIPSSLIKEYYSDFDSIIDQLNLNVLIDEGELFVVERFNKLLDSIDNGISNYEAKILSKAFKNISLPEVVLHINTLKVKEKKMKIFQIGFNKSGTGSIYHYFRQEGFKAAHWEKGTLSRTLKENFENGSALLKGYEDHQVYTDMEHRESDQTAVYSAELYFKELDKQYPGSIFILNYRNVDKWINSRVNHPGYLDKTMQSTGLTKEQVIDEWKKNYFQHIQNVNSYFSGKNNLIVIDLDADDSKKLYQELSKRGVELSAKELPHTHKTKSINSEDKQKQKHINLVRNAALFFEKSDVQTAYELMKIANKLRPEGKYIQKKLDEYKKFV